MNKTFKGFVLGVVITTLLMGTAFGVSVSESITVVRNSINLTVNGQKVNADNFVHEGTTYVPLRAIGEMLGKDVGWNAATRTASINDKGSSVSVSTEPVLYENDKVKIMFHRLTDDGMEFMVQNKTNLVLTIFSDTLAINGVGVQGYIMMADDVSPQSTGVVDARFSTAGFTDPVHTLSGQLRISDMATRSFSTIKATFVNVNVK